LYYGPLTAKMVRAKEAKLGNGKLDAETADLRVTLSEGPRGETDPGRLALYLA
jgi:hypothetical protein